MSERLKIPKEKLKWACFDFTPEEDLVLITTDGNLYLIDIKSGEFKENGVSLGLEFQSKPIEDAKVIENVIVFRNNAN